MHRRHRPILAPILCLALSAAAQTPTDATAPPAMKLPSDQAAYKAANAILDPQQHAAALETFLHDFPDSKRAGSARSRLLDLLLETHAAPKRIHHVASEIVKNAGPYVANADNEVAWKLAMAPGGGVDLKSAEHWVKDSLKRSTLQSTEAEMRASNARFKEPPPTAADVHEAWASNRAEVLQTLAEVQVRRGELDDASRTLTEILALDPQMGAAYSTRAEVAQARHNDKQALEDLELAEVYGGDTREDRSRMTSLYAAQHGGSTDGLTAVIDRRYRALPSSFTPPPRTPAKVSRPVLVELFTGSGCHPCIAADLAIEALLNTYPSTEVVALVLDQHIPLPDPLSNPSTVARATFDSIQGTPSVRVDGAPSEIEGGGRSWTQAVYKRVVSDVDKALAQPTGVTLQLTLHSSHAQIVKASAEINITDPAVAQKVLTSPMPVDRFAPPAKKGTAAPEPSHLVVNFALVEREIRYSGENGVRFHQNVVRSIARPSTEGFPVGLTGDSSAAFTFDLPAITAGLDTYLADFSKHSDRFDTTTFLQTDTALPPHDLSVAAWVEDPVTHHVLAAAITPVDPSAATTQQASR